MQSNVLFANFILRTCDVGNLGDGTINPNRSQITWKNVDLKTITGAMWDQYDYFTITLVTFMNTALTNVPYTTISGGYLHDNSSAMIYMQGLPFVNCTYNYVNRSNSASAVVGTFKFNSDSSASLVQSNSSNAVIFAKGQPITDITISLIRLVDGGLIVPIGVTGNSYELNGMIYNVAACFPDQCYIFRIDGIYNSHANAKM